MSRLLIGLLALALAGGMPWAATAEETAKVAMVPVAGQTAPAFRAQDQNGHWRSLADYRGHWLVVYFYPKDFTPGCTSEICSFRDAVLKLRQADAQVVGVSVGSVTSHARFAKAYHAPFPLLADSAGQIAASYGVLSGGDHEPRARRETFLIAPDGRIAVTYGEVDPEQNAAQVLADLARLKQQTGVKHVVPH